MILDTLSFTCSIEEEYFLSIVRVVTLPAPEMLAELAALSRKEAVFCGCIDEIEYAPKFFGHSEKSTFNLLLIRAL